MKRAVITLLFATQLVATVSAQRSMQKKIVPGGRIVAESAVSQEVMPNVSTGKFTCEEAKKTLIEQVHQERVVCLAPESSDFPDRTVFEQDPLPQTRLLPSTKITLHISNGQATTPPPDTDADVSVVETHEKKPAYFAGDEVHYKIIVSNAGPLTATNVRITNTQLNLRDSTFQTTSAECTGGVCTIKRLDPGRSAGINVTATILAEGQFTNVVTVKADEPDRNNNNTSNDTAEAKPSADVSVTLKLDGSGPLQAGQTINYILTIHNDGPSNASNIQVSPRRRTNLKFNGVAGACKTLPCLIPNLEAHADATITLTALIDQDGPFGTEVEVRAAEHDGTPGNNIIETKDRPTPTASPTPVPSPTNPQPFPPIWVWPILILGVGGSVVGGGAYGVRRIRRRRERRRLNGSQPAVDPSVVLRPGESKIDRLQMAGPQIRLHTDLRTGPTTFDGPIPIARKDVSNE